MRIVRSLLLSIVLLSALASGAVSQTIDVAIVYNVNNPESGVDTLVSNLILMMDKTWVKNNRSGVTENVGTFTYNTTLIDDGVWATYTISSIASYEVIIVSPKASSTNLSAGPDLKTFSGAVYSMNNLLNLGLGTTAFYDGDQIRHRGPDLNFINKRDVDSVRCHSSLGTDGRMNPIPVANVLNSVKKIFVSGDGLRVLMASCAGGATLSDGTIASGSRVYNGLRAFTTNNWLEKESYPIFRREIQKGVAYLVGDTLPNSWCERVIFVGEVGEEMPSNWNEFSPDDPVFKSYPQDQVRIGFNFKKGVTTYNPKGIDRIVPDNANQTVIWSAYQHHVDYHNTQSVTDVTTNNVATIRQLGLGAASVVSDAGNSVLSFKTDATSTVNDIFVGTNATFTSGANNTEFRKITAYSGTTKFVTVGIAFSNIPSAGDKVELNTVLYEDTVFNIATGMFPIIKAGYEQLDVAEWFHQPNTSFPNLNTWLTYEYPSGSGIIPFPNGLANRYGPKPIGAGSVLWDAKEFTRGVDIPTTPWDSVYWSKSTVLSGSSRSSDSATSVNTGSPVATQPSDNTIVTGSVDGDWDALITHRANDSAINDWVDNGHKDFIILGLYHPGIEECENGTNADREQRGRIYSASGLEIILSSVGAVATNSHIGAIKLGTAQQGIDGTCDFGYGSSTTNAVDTMAKYFSRIAPYGECGSLSNPLYAADSTIDILVYISLLDMDASYDSTWATSGTYWQSRKVGWMKNFLDTNKLWTVDQREKMYLHFYDTTTFSVSGVTKTINGCLCDSSTVTAADSVSRVPNGYANSSSYWAGNTYTRNTRLFPNLTSPEVRIAEQEYVGIACSTLTGGSLNFWPGKTNAFQGVFFDNSADIGLGLSVLTGGHIVESYDVSIGAIASNIDSMVVTTVTTGAFVPANRTAFDIWWWENNMKPFLMGLDTLLDSLATPSGKRAKYMLNAGFDDAPDHFHDAAIGGHENLLEWGGVNGRGHSNADYKGSGAFVRSMDTMIAHDSIAALRGNTRQVWVRTVIGTYTGAQTATAGGGTQDWHEGWMNTYMMFMVQNGDSTYYDMWDNHVGYFGSGNPTAGSSDFDSTHFGSQGTFNFRQTLNVDFGAVQGSRPVIYDTGTVDGDHYEVWSRQYAGIPAFPNGYRVLFRERSGASTEFMSNSTPAAITLDTIYSLYGNNYAGANGAGDTMDFWADSLTTATYNTVYLRAGEGVIMYSSASNPPPPSGQGSRRRHVINRIYGVNQDVMRSFGFVYQGMDTWIGSEKSYPEFHSSGYVSDGELNISVIDLTEKYDVNADGRTNIADLTEWISVMFQGNPAGIAGLKIEEEQ